MIHSILVVQFTCLAVLCHNLCTSPLCLPLGLEPSPSYSIHSSPSYLPFATHAHTIATCSAEVPKLSPIFKQLLKQKLVSYHYTKLVAIVKHSRHHTYSPIYYDRESTDSPHVSMHSTLHIHSIADLLLLPTAAFHNSSQAVCRLSNANVEIFLKLQVEWQKMCCN